MILCFALVDGYNVAIMSVVFFFVSQSIKFTTSAVHCTTNGIIVIGIFPKVKRLKLFNFISYVHMMTDREMSDADGNAIVHVVNVYRENKFSVTFWCDIKFVIVSFGLIFCLLWSFIIPFPTKTFREGKRNSLTHTHIGDRSIWETYCEKHFIYVMQCLQSDKE